jgi:hypothetical protein
MKKLILLSGIAASFFFFQGCASSLILKDVGVAVESQNKEVSYCKAEQRKVVWNDTVMGQFYSKDSNSKLNKYEQTDLSIIFSQLDKLMNKTCAASTNVIVEISNTPINESRGLKLLNTISFGIIPYWDEYENKIKIDFYRDGNLVDSYISSLLYTRIQSIFLWPAAPFSLTSSHELNIKTIPMHFNNISEQIHKGSGLK